jgi:hypothetical protein
MKPMACGNCGQMPISLLEKGGWKFRFELERTITTVFLSHPFGNII